MSENINSDVQAGSRSYNRLDIQVSQALHMAIELFEDVNFLLVLDYGDDISIFNDPDNPTSVSYYQVKTSDDTIILSTIISENWLPKLYEHLADPSPLIETLGLITNCPVKLDDNQILREEKTPFSKFNNQTIQKIKNDISNKMKIAEENVDLSKFVHFRTTLTIDKHRDMVEKDLGDFLQTKYPRITVESAKTIFKSIIDMMTRRQEYERLPKNADFPTVRAKKGVSKDDINRVVKMAMLLSIPEFSVIEKMASFNEDEKYKASYEYAKILADSQKNDEGFYTLLKKLQDIMDKNPISADETANRDYVGYANRIIALVPNNPIYSNLYEEIIILSILYNNWKDN